MLEKLYITENMNEKDKWMVSFEKPDFQGGESFYIDEKTAIEIMNIQQYYYKNLMQIVVEDVPHQYQDRLIGVIEQLK